MKYDVHQLANLEYGDAIKRDISRYLINEKAIDTAALCDLFELSDRAAQFVIKGVVLAFACSPGGEKSRRLIEEFQTYSYGHFAYYEVSSSVKVNTAVEVIYDQAYTMAKALLGEA